MAIPSSATTFFLLLLPFLTLASFPAGNERRSHLHFYIHDKISRPNATAVKVAAVHSGTLPSATNLHFGNIFVVDDLITDGPDPASKTVGRARGFYTVSSIKGSELYFTAQLIFTEGSYKGSSITMAGRDAVLEEVRELSVVGGSGLFRMARGFILIRTYSFDVASGDAVLNVNAYVFHH